MKYCPDGLWRFLRGKTLLFTVEKSNHLSVCLQLSVVSSVAERKTEKETSPGGISNPLLVCTAAAIQQKQDYPSRCLHFGPPDEMINAKKCLFC